VALLTAGCAASGPTSGNSATNGDAKVGGNAAKNLTVNKSYWHAGWQVDLQTAKVRASTADPKTSVLAIDAMFHNLGADTHTPESLLVLEVDGESLGLDKEESSLPEVPAGGKQSGTIAFDLPGAAGVDSAVLKVGQPTNNQASIPLGAAGEQVTLEPRKLPLKLAGTVKTDGPTGVKLDVKVTGGELRADNPRRYEEAKKGTLRLTLTYAVTFHYTCYCSPDWLEGNMQLVLPDGTSVGSEMHDYPTGFDSGATKTDLTSQFVIKDPPAGEYKLVLRVHGKQTAIPFTVTAG
jgi:hypothetical protein